MNQDLPQILFAEEALDWLDSSGRQSAWELLYQRCPWRFPTLGPVYYRLWFQHYGVEWQPLLVFVATDKGGLRLIMPLAVREGLITGVGAKQAEYQGWLSCENENSELLQAALLALDKRLPAYTLRLHYLAPGISKDTVQRLCESNPRAMSTTHSRPLMRLDDESAQKALRKKSTRSKVNRLKRQGELSFRRLTDIADIESHLDAIIAMYDFRQGATNDSCPFVDDPHKKPFLLDWARQSSGKELHISCLMLDDEVIGAHIGVISGNTSQLAILAYSPRYSAFSPGKIQIYETARLLTLDSVSFLDLTPGGDPWKERFANEHDSVMSLTVFSDRRTARGLRLKNYVESLARGLLERVGVSPSDIKGMSRKLRQPLRSRGTRDDEHKTGTFKVYQLIANPPLDHLDTKEVHRDALNELALYEDNGEGRSRQAFLQEALSRVESGESVYTLVQNNRLAACAWVGHGQTGSADIYDILHSGEQANRQGQLIAGVLAHLKDSAVETVKIHLRPQDSEDDTWITDLGFVPTVKSDSDEMGTDQSEGRTG